MFLPHVAFDSAAGGEELTETKIVQAIVPAYAVVKVALFETGLSGRQRYWQFSLEAARQGVDRFSLGVRVPTLARVLSSQYLFGAQEAHFIFGDSAVYHILRRVKRKRAVQVIRRESLTLNRGSQVIAKRFHSGEMAADARTPVADKRVVGLIAIGYDFQRSGVNAPPLRVGQKIRLQTVRQVENDFTARRVEPQRIGEDVLIAQIASEVVTAPVGADGRDVALQRAVVLRHPARTHAGANHMLLFGQLPRCVNSQAPFQFGDAVRQSEQFVIYRRR